MSINIEVISQLRELGLKDPSKLTNRQQIFALHYIKNPDNTHDALKKAGYKTEKRFARMQVYKLLNNPIIKEYIEVKQKKIVEKLELNAEWVLKRHQRVVDQFIPLSDEAVLDIKEVSCAQNSLDGICKIGGLYKKEAEKPDDDEDVERAKQYAREHAKEF